MTKKSAFQFSKKVSKCFEFAKRQYSESFIGTKNTWKHQNEFFEILDFRKFFYRVEIHSAEKEALSSTNAFFQEKTYLEVKGVLFD